MKLYKEEIGSPDVERLVGSSQSVATSSLAFVEAHSAFGLSKRLARANQATLEARSRPELDIETAYAHMTSAFNEDWRSRNYFAVSVSTRLIRLAARLCQQYPLRAYDGIHVASAALLMRRIGTDLVFSSYDPAQLSAATAEGLMLAR